MTTIKNPNSAESDDSLKLEFEINEREAQNPNPFDYICCAMKLRLLEQINKQKTSTKLILIIKELDNLQDEFFDKILEEITRSKSDDTIKFDFKNESSKTFNLFNQEVK